MGRLERALAAAERRVEALEASDHVNRKVWWFEGAGRETRGKEGEVHARGERAALSIHRLIARYKANGPRVDRDDACFPLAIACYLARLLFPTLLVLFFLLFVSSPPFFACPASASRAILPSWRASPISACALHPPRP